MFRFCAKFFFLSCCLFLVVTTRPSLAECGWAGAHYRTLDASELTDDFAKNLNSQKRSENFGRSFQADDCLGEFHFSSQILTDELLKEIPDRGFDLSLNKYKKGQLANRYEARFIEGINVPNEMKTILVDANSLSEIGKQDRAKYLEKKMQIDLAITDMARDALTEKNGFIFPKQNNADLVASIAQAHSTINGSDTTPEEFQTYISDILKAPKTLPVLSFDPNMPFDFDECPGCQIIGVNGLIRFPQIDKDARRTLDAVPIQVAKNLLPAKIDWNFEKIMKEISSSVILITVRNKIKIDANGKYLSLPAGSYCQNKVSHHCSGFPNTSGDGLYTANHCIRALLKGYTIDKKLRQLRVGESANCSANNPLRFVKELGRVRIRKNVRDEDIRNCKSIRRISEDAVYVEFSSPIKEFSTELDKTIYYPDELAENIEMNKAAIQRFRRTAGFGFAHTQDLVFSNGGYVDQNHSCRRTFAETGHGYRIPNHDPFGVGVGDFLCVSSDSLNGMSGGPVFSLIGENMIALIGVFSFAHGSTRSAECKFSRLNVIAEEMGSGTGSYNVISRLD